MLATKQYSIVKPCSNNSLPSQLGAKIRRGFFQTKQDAPNGTSKGTANTSGSTTCNKISLFVIITEITKLGKRGVYTPKLTLPLTDSSLDDPKGKEGNR
jgi:hypothetical protein